MCYPIAFRAASAKLTIPLVKLAVYSVAAEKTDESLDANSGWKMICTENMS